MSKITIINNGASIEVERELLHGCLAARSALLTKSRKEKKDWIANQIDILPLQPSTTELEALQKVIERYIFDIQAIRIEEEKLNKLIEYVV